MASAWSWTSPHPWSSGRSVNGTVNLSNPRATFAGSPPRFTRSRVTYEAYVVSRTSTRPQVDSAGTDPSFDLTGDSLVCRTGAPDGNMPSAKCRPPHPRRPGPRCARRSSSSASATSIDGNGPPRSRAARRRAATNRSSASMGLNVTHLATLSDSFSARKSPVDVWWMIGFMQLRGGTRS